MPTMDKLHVSQLLSNVSVQYKNEEYIWPSLMPQVSVMKDTDLYRVYERNFRIPETKRANKGVAREHTFDVSTASYILENHALKDYVGKEEADNYDQESLEIDTTENLTDAIYRRIEFAVCSLFTTTNFSLNVSLAAAWTSNTTTTDPVPTCDTASATILGNSGKKPNVMAISNAAFIAAKNHVSVLDRVKYTSSEVSQNMLSALFGVGELLVSTAQYDSSAEGVAASMSAFWDNSAFLGWKPSSPGRKTPSFGYLFMKNAPRVRKWIDQEREESTAVEVSVKYSAKIVASLCGYLIKGVT